jgi:hypothetical protein
MAKKLLAVPLIFIAILTIQTYSAQLQSSTPATSSVKGEEDSIYLTTQGQGFRLNGKPYTFTGANLYGAGSLSEVNIGCGGEIKDIASLMASLKPESIIRFWGFKPTIGTNVQTKENDFTGIDRVLTLAQFYNHRVIISLADQSGTCDGGVWKNLSWYEQGYKDSYLDYVEDIVSKYKDSPVIAMWEPVNEPETADCKGFTGSKCYGHQICKDHDKAAHVLRGFFDTVGGKIKEIDPNHLVESGVIGNGQCGADNDYYTYVHESPGIDVASYHDYNEVDNAMPGDQWNGLLRRIEQMKTINKPLIIGESGMLASDTSRRCMSFDERKEKIQKKMEAQFGAGVSGYLLWNLSTIDNSVCNYDIPPNDPLMKLL